MRRIDGDMLMKKIDGLLKEHSNSVEKWLANQIHIAVNEAPTMVSEIPTGSDLIRRQDAIDAIDKDIMGGLNYRSILERLPSAEPKCGGDLISRQALCRYALNQKDKSVTPNDIMRFPSAEPRTGKWTEIENGEYLCSNCFRITIGYPPNRCPNCGSYNGGEEE